MCEKKLNEGLAEQAIKEAEMLDNMYDQYFCKGKAYYRSNSPKSAALAFEASEEYADLPVDQMFSILYKGISQRDSGQIEISIQSFSKGLETAKLGNSKYLQMEQRFLYQLGKSHIALKNGESALEEHSKALTISSNDDERALNFEGISLAYGLLKQYDSAIEYAVKASNSYQRTGKLGNYADIEVYKSKFYFASNNSDMAIKTLKTLEAFSIKNGGKYYEAKSLIEQSILYKSIVVNDNANLTLSKGLKISREICATDLIPAKVRN